MNSYEVKPKVGIGELTLGITKSEVISILGLPEEDDRANEEWWYDSNDISLSFESGELCSIEIMNKNLQIFNTAIANYSISEICALLEKHTQKYITKEEEEEIVVSCEELGLFFVCINSNLNYVQLIQLP